MDDGWIMVDGWRDGNSLDFGAVVCGMPWRRQELWTIQVKWFSRGFPGIPVGKPKPEPHAGIFGAQPHPQLFIPQFKILVASTGGVYLS